MGFDQFLCNVASDFDGFLDRAALRNKALNLIAGRQIQTLR